MLCSGYFDIHRREFLRVGSTALLAMGASLPQEAPAQEKIRTSAHILIVGSGLGGIAIASRLQQGLEGARITLLDRKEEHNYQPGYTLVGTGIWSVHKVRDRNSDFQPAGVHWIKEMAADFDPHSNTVITDTGQRIRYDFLVIASGVHLDYAQIAGMDPAAIGQNGLASVYYGPQGAEASWKAMQAFCAKGGQAVMTLPATPLKCAGAPLKTTFMLRDRLKQSGRLSRSNVHFYSALKNVFGVPVINDTVIERWQTLGIEVDYLHKLTAIDIHARRAYFARPEGADAEIPYDFIHVVPPMRAPDAIRNSPLPWQNGPMAVGGWLEVDKSTLQHRRFPNIFGIGDINGTPRGKTAATVKKSAPIVTNNLMVVIAGRQPTEIFDGYTSCPLLLREGSALLIEFDYEGNLTPSLPLINPLQESWFAWLMKTQLLKPAYIAVLKGRV